MDWLVLAGAAAEAVSQVLVVVACGVVLSRTGYLTQTAQKSISKVNLYFMTPCLLFTKIASTINWTQFKAFWPIPVFYAFFSIISWAVAKVGSRLLRFSPDEEKFVIASVLFSNTNSLPMALLQSLAFSAAGDRLLRDENDTKEAVAARGISYILFFAIFGNLVRWSYGFTLLVPQDKEEAPVSPSVPQGILIDVEAPSSTSAAPVYEHSPFVNRTSHLHPLAQSSGHLPLPMPRSPAPSTRSLLMQKSSSAFDRVRQVLTPPLMTAIIALIIGLVPALHQVFMSPDSGVYRFLVRPIENCGSAAIPMILLCLGAQVVHFAENAKSKPAPPRSVAQPRIVSSASSASDATSRPYQTGLGIYTEARDESSSDEDTPGGLSARDGTGTYGSGIATVRSHASSSATLLHFNNQPGDLTKDQQRSRQGSSGSERPRTLRHGSTSSTSSSVSEEELPLLGTLAHVHNYRIKWLTPTPFILFARMVLVPLVAMPAILFHPESLSPILTMDPTFSLALVLLAAAPTAINLIQICQIKGFFENEMAAVLFWSYCVLGIPCVLGWSLVGLWAAGR